tara:strand:- start:7791 stop:9560 length:1770 start_codon:yes stop_codon:yes gene_type:complete
MIKKVSTFLILGIITGIITCLIYIKSIISIRLPSPEAASTKKVSIDLERGGIVDEKLLNNFLIFFSDNEKVFEKIIDKKNVLKSHYLENKAVVNSCGQANCLQRVKSLAEMSPFVWESLINTEDARFLSHIGLDPFSIARAMIVNIVKGRYAQGASTITQQLVKNIFLTNEKTLQRKLKEAMISVYIEILYDKDEIIETYLNNVYWGSFQGIQIKGVEAASNFYFQKKAKSLSFNESLILISMLKGPGYYHPVRHPKRLKKRVKNLADVFITNQIIDLDEKRDLISDLNAWLQGFDAKENIGLINYLVTLPAKEDITFDGYVLQNSANKVLSKINSLKKVEFNYEILRRGSEELKYDYSFHKGKLKHQVGSILKPLVYSIILEDRDLNEEVPTSKITLKLNSGEWSPRDHFKESETSVTLRGAIQRSLNTPLISLASEYGFDRLEKDLQKFVPSLKVPLKEYPSQLLGSVELNLFEVDTLFQKYFKSVCTNESFKMVYESLLDPTVTTIARRSKELAGLSFFGKTGTSNGSLDNWFIFQGGEETIIIWFGFLGVRDSRNFKLSGASTSFEILKGYLLARGKRVGQFSCD